ncbi:MULTISPECIES: hypothetical protein [Pseudomonas aeruginosa group]|uniref:hypothetical protein n=1 Tax=Pseudomonas aeruginosa group TaxID=136841 RepID=UPI000A77E630|nr:MULTISPECIES: hypothetical protein [Pseudomonas aeruginosa group]KAA5628700.1 hypothetical protein F3H11_14320 [Pseudomonas aeruginosa]KAA5641990.1 hypothetical protein F3G63_20570 [Pseudomonas aeruginosa]MBG6487120.1 hypothetical protein [Pseudomonas aeruginosa]MBG7007076.1 hypothetical protein [Pseudomonas aeruginosa]MBG7025941.1 hypothetical protein [Pseudomonas aeruginosa]
MKWNPRSTMAIALLALTGCATQAPYGTPEATANLMRDLSLSKPPQVVVPADWADSPYGISEGVQTTKGLLVSEEGGLRFVTYDGQRFHETDELRRPDLECGYIWSGDSGSELVHLFRADRFYMLKVGAKKIDADPAQRSELVRYLRSQGVPLLTSQEGTFFRPTGRTKRGISTVPAAPGMPNWTVTIDDEQEAFNPCHHG